MTLIYGRRRDTNNGQAILLAIHPTPQQLSCDLFGGLVALSRTPSFNSIAAADDVCESPLVYLPSRSRPLFLWWDYLVGHGDVLPGFSYAEEDKDSQEIISVEMDECPRFNDCANNGKIAVDR